ncbi:alpha/beta hydrolase [Candidatus Pelagibacter sp. Uisw_099_02]|uniref:alpha/beta hydrolase n=1 Tax=Candidatus Pelagibacter sp. Uisw_099_02 TaxID=3230981 RepID=UPI0039ED484A
MSKFKYLKITNLKKIRYLSNNVQNSLYIIFLHGFMSDIEGDKPISIFNYAKKNKLGFLALEYSGHGKSTGKFTNGNISKWSKDVKVLIKRKVKKNNFILVGSSMGSWLSLNQFKYFKKQIKGFLGIGSAPEFLENLMWKKFTKRMKNEIIKKGIINLKHGNYEYPISYQLIKDGRRNKVLNKKILSKINVTMIHGDKDEVVPKSYSKKILKIFKRAKKKLVIIKNGDHSLSNKHSLKKINLELDKIVSNII